MVNAYDLRENLYALILSAHTGCTPEMAFRELSGQKGKHNTTITQADVLEMARLKDAGMSYSEIGDLYGLSAKAVYGRMKRMKEKRGDSHGKATPKSAAQ